MTDRILRPKDFFCKLGIAQTTGWRRVREGEIQPPIRIGPNSVGWLESYGDALIAERAATPYQPSGRGKVAAAVRLAKKAGQ